MHCTEISTQQPIQKCGEKYAVQEQPLYMARTLLKSPTLRQATLNEVVNAVKCECNSMCQLLPKPSILCTGSTSSYRDFNWPLLLNELNSKAPTLLTILKAASGCDCACQKSLIPPEVAASILLYSRSKHLCRVQTFVGGILYTGHAAKKVHECDTCTIVEYIY